jgi:hypothetical protein
MPGSRRYFFNGEERREKGEGREENKDKTNIRAIYGQKIRTIRGECSEMCVSFLFAGQSPEAVGERAFPAQALYSLKGNPTHNKNIGHSLKNSYPHLNPESLAL